MFFVLIMFLMTISCYATQENKAVQGQSQSTQATSTSASQQPVQQNSQSQKTEVERNVARELLRVLQQLESKRRPTTPAPNQTTYHNCIIPINHRHSRQERKHVRESKRPGINYKKEI